MIAKPCPRGITDGPAGPILPQPRLPRTGATRARKHPRPQPQGAALPLHHLRPNLRRHPRPAPPHPPPPPPPATTNPHPRVGEVGGVFFPSPRLPAPSDRRRLR